MLRFVAIFYNVFHSTFLVAIRKRRHTDQHFSPLSFSLTLACTHTHSHSLSLRHTHAHTHTLKHTFFASWAFLYSHTQQPVLGPVLLSYTHTLTCPSAQKFVCFFQHIQVIFATAQITQPYINYEQFISYLFFLKNFR